MKKLLATSLAAVMTLTACGGGAAPEEPAKGNEGGNETSTEAQAPVVLRVGQGADAASLDPHGKNDQPSSRVRTNIYESLVYQDNNLEVQPLLAKSWSVDDAGTVWTFELQDGVTFHNGEDFDASDVVFSLNRAKASANVGHLLETVKEVRATGDHTVELELEYPYMALLNNLSHPTMGMLDETTVTNQGDDYASTNNGNNPIGTAPLMFKEFIQGTGTTLAKFDGYWNASRIPQFDEVQILTYTDNSSRKLALEAGDIDIAYDIAQSDYESVKSNSDLTVVEDYDLSYAYLGFNMENPKFADVRVREAINLAIDVNSIIQAPTIMNGLAIQANTPISMKAFGWTDKVEPYGYDVERAKELLAEAGVENLNFSIWTNENPTRVQAATVIQAQLAEIGVTVDVVQMEWGAYLDSTAAGEHDIFILGWTTVTADADYGLYPMFHSESKGSAGNRTFYENAEVDALLEKGRAASTVEERLQAYEEAQIKIMADYVHIPLWNTLRVFATRNNIEGFVPHPSGSMKLDGVTIN